MIIATGASRRCTHWKNEDITWDQLAERLTQVRRTQETAAQYAAMSPEMRTCAKDVGGFVGGELTGERRKADAVKSRQLLVLDADFAPEDFWDACTAFSVPWACVAHTTHSHLPEAPRYRLVLPLRRPVSAEEYEAVARWVSNDIGMEWFDDTTYEPSRLMYWPSASADGEFLSYRQDGSWLDPDWVLGKYANWHDVTEWPHTERSRALTSASGAKQGDPREKPGIVGAFCRVYDVPGAIAEYLSDVYIDGAEGRYTFAGGSTAQGMVLFDDGLFCRSYHSTDPAQGHLINAFDLVRIHLYGNLDDDADEDTPINQLSSFNAMRGLCRNDKTVMAELGDSTAEEDFSAYEEAELKQLSTGTDQDMALAFRDFARPWLRYNKSLGWLSWSGNCWLVDCEARARMLVMEFNNTVWARANTLDGKAGEAARKSARAMRSTAKISAMLVNAKALLADDGEWDIDPWALNTPAGIVDLHDGSIHAHDPEKRCTAITACPMDTEGMDAPMWKRFLRDITGGDADLERYMQDMMGEALVGKIYEEGMLIVTGTGGNGKSTLFGALGALLGGYAATIRPEILLARANGSDAFGLEQVRGKRLVIAGETDQGAALSISTLKRLAGRDAISANPKYKDPITFQPSHLMVLHTNHLPRFRDTDGGTRRRLAVAVFPHTPKPEKVIPDLMDRLVAQEGPAILRWMVEGSVRFAQNGCRVVKPESVIRETGKYIDEQDWLTQFLSDVCETGNGYTVLGGNLLAEYNKWCNSNNEKPRRSRDFAAALEERGFSRKKTMTGAVWTGLRICSDFME